MKFDVKAFIKSISLIAIIAIWAVILSPLIVVLSGGTSVGFADTAAGRKVYLGGFPVGLSIKPEGVIVSEIVPVETAAGKVYPKTALISGDVIQKIEGTTILYTVDIFSAMESVDKGISSVKIDILRNGNKTTVESSPVKEELTGQLKLGLAVRESISGVGTVSFIKMNNYFACLGHPISGESNSILPCYSGSSYDCKIVGYNKGIRGKAGELKGVFTGSTANGQIFKNTKFGVVGKYENLKPDLPIMEIGGRSSVNAGKAKIITTIADKPEEFEIEIIKANTQLTPDDKSMVIRVTDKRLLSLTGGILQGMSGSPIIQNDKIVGAVTHVFINDPTKGYGIYSDWMYSM